MTTDPWEMTVAVAVETNDRATAINPAEVRRALAILLAPGGIHAIQALPSGRWRAVRVEDLDTAVAAVAELAGGVGLYYTLNPLGRTDEKYFRSSTMTGRRWLLVDCDPTHPADVSATEDEKEEAARLMTAVAADLAARGWPGPVVIDSGNGWHLLYRIDLPNDRLSQQIVAACLRALAAKHNAPGATVDTKNHDAKRIAKLPGTMARKGPDLPDRPHRMARLAEVPATIGVVALDQLRELAGLKDAEPVPTPPKADPWTMRAGLENGTGSYALAALHAEVGKVAGSLPGGRNGQLYESALKLGGYVSGGLLDRAEVIRQLTLAARAAGLGGGHDPNEIDRAIANGLAAGETTPKSEPKAKPEAAKSTDGRRKKMIDPGPAPAGIPLVIWANTVKPRKVEWLWPGRIPLGKLTTFAGRTGLGKTFALCDIAARISRGEEWPFSGGECADPGKVLLISAEDDVDDTLVPRLMEMGANLSRIAFLSPEAEERFTLAALELLGSVLDAMDDDVRCVAIDPPTSYLSGVDDHNNAELRSVLAPLKRWAAKRRVAVILNTHVNKGSGQNVEAIARVVGSVAWVNAVRAAYLFAADPEDRDRRLWINLKLNVAKEPPGLAYRIDRTEGDGARLVWVEEVLTTAEEALGKEQKKPVARNAADWLKDMFTRRREWPSDLFWAELKAGGVTEHALNKVRDALAIPKAKRVAGPNGDVHWLWTVPPDWPHFLGQNGRHGVEELEPKPF